MDHSLRRQYATAAARFALKAAPAVIRAVEKAERVVPGFKRANDWIRARSPTQSFFILAADFATGPAFPPLYVYLSYTHGVRGALMASGIFAARRALKTYAHPLLAINTLRSDQYRRMRFALKRDANWRLPNFKSASRIAFGANIFHKIRRRFAAFKTWAKRERRFLTFQAGYQSTWGLPLVMPSNIAWPTLAGITFVSAPYMLDNLHRIARRSCFYRRTHRTAKRAYYGARVPLRLSPIMYVPH